MFNHVWSYKNRLIRFGIIFVRNGYIQRSFYQIKFLVATIPIFFLEFQ